MDVKLVVQANGKATQTFQLRSKEMIIGRQKGCGIRIPSSQVSRQHCLISFQDDLLSLEDLASANGTFINGRRIAKREFLRPGDSLKVGPVTLLVQYQLTEAAVQKLLQDDQEIVVDPLDDVEVVPNTGDAEVELIVDDEDTAPLVLDGPLELDPVDNPVDDPLAALRAIEDKASAPPPPAKKKGHAPAPKKPPVSDDGETQTFQLPPPKRVKLSKTETPAPAPAPPEPEEEEGAEPAPDASQILGPRNWQLPTGEDIRDILAQIEKGKKKS